ncbi:hypothetical protein BC832DRAFT_558958 [Gaertneriomyces semiglobifer]|nr:hypothetical protein BC832DRAFT_558958 [Gaertneriomyces semiglobifer]
MTSQTPPKALPPTSTTAQLLPHTQLPLSHTQLPHPSTTTSKHTPPSLTSASELLLLAEDVVSHGVAATAGIFLHNKKGKGSVDVQNRDNTLQNRNNKVEGETNNGEISRVEGANHSDTTQSGATHTTITPHLFNPPTHTQPTHTHPLLGSIEKPPPPTTSTTKTKTTNTNTTDENNDEGDVMDDEMESMLEILDE